MLSANGFQHIGKHILRARTAPEHWKTQPRSVNGPRCSENASSERPRFMTLLKKGLRMFQACCRARISPRRLDLHRCPSIRPCKGNSNTHKEICQNMCFNDLVVPMQNEREIARAVQLRFCALPLNSVLSSTTKSSGRRRDLIGDEVCC